MIIMTGGKERERPPYEEVAQVRNDHNLPMQILQNHQQHHEHAHDRQGADPNTQDNAGWSPLHEACNHGNEVWSPPGPKIDHKCKN